jgi:hypothetical protein
VRSRGIVLEHRSLDPSATNKPSCLLPSNLHVELDEDAPVPLIGHPFWFRAIFPGAELAVTVPWLQECIRPFVFRKWLAVGAPCSLVTLRKGRECYGTPGVENTIDVRSREKRPGEEAAQPHRLPNATGQGHPDLPDGHLWPSLRSRAAALLGLGIIEVDRSDACVGHIAVTSPEVTTSRETRTVILPPFVNTARGHGPANRRGAQR